MDYLGSVKAMTKKEFFDNVKKYGINLNNFQIALGYKTNVMYYSGIFEKENGKWVFYKVGDRTTFSILYTGTEENAFQKLYDDLFGQMDLEGYITKSISDKVIETSYHYVCDFLQKKYDISQNDAEDAWEYLLYDFHVLNEVKYFALNNKFVPKDDCYRVEGYSAEDIADELGLNAIDSYKYLINLEKHPEQALKDLKNGLPRKCKSK